MMARQFKAAMETGTSPAPPLTGLTIKLKWHIFFLAQKGSMAGSYKTGNTQGLCGGYPATSGLFAAAVIGGSNTKSLNITNA